MSVTPTGHLSLPVDRLRRTIADSATFQTWTGLTPLATALGSVYYRKAAAAATKPFAIVETPADFDRRLVAERFDNVLQETRGTLIVRFKGAVVGATSDDDAAIDFDNKLWGVADDVEQAAGTLLSDGSNAFAFESVSVEQPPQRPEEDEAKTLADFYEAALRFTFRAPAP